MIRIREPPIERRLRLSAPQQILDEIRHAHVDLARELDEADVKVEFPRLPRKIERIERNAVAADARSGIESHDTERLGRGGIDHFPNVDAEPVAEHSHLVDQRDIDRPKRVLENFRHLRNLWGRHRQNVYDRLLVESRRLPDTPASRRRQPCSCSSSCTARYPDRPARAKSTGRNLRRTAVPRSRIGSSTSSVVPG